MLSVIEKKRVQNRSNPSRLAWVPRLYISIGFSLTALVSASPIAFSNVPKDSCQRGHGTGSRRQCYVQECADNDCATCGFIFISRPLYSHLNRGRFMVMTLHCCDSGIGHTALQKATESITLYTSEFTLLLFLSITGLLHHINLLYLHSQRIFLIVDLPPLEYPCVGWML